MSETYLKLRSILEKVYEETERELVFFAEIRRLLVEKFVGKQINKRVITYIHSKHPSWLVSFYGVGNSTYIRVWGGDSGFTYDNHGRVFIGYHDTHSNGFSVEAFDANNQQIPSTIAAQTQREALLADTAEMLAIGERIESFNADRDRLDALLEKHADRYAFKKLAGL